MSHASSSHIRKVFLTEAVVSFAIKADSMEAEMWAQANRRKSISRQ